MSDSLVTKAAQELIKCCELLKAAAEGYLELVNAANQFGYTSAYRYLKQGRRVKRAVWKYHYIRLNGVIPVMCQKGRDIADYVFTPSDKLAVDWELVL